MTITERPTISNPVEATVTTEMRDKIRLVVTVKAYPTATAKYGEAVCVAGIRTDTPRPQWVRLYPVEFRDLPYDQQFRKWSEIEVNVSASNDSRPESLRPDTSTIRVLRQLSSDRGWADRRSLVEPVVVDSMCAVLARQLVDGTSLAAFRPYTVHDVVIDVEPDDWTADQTNKLNKLSLFAQDKRTLEKIPWRWKYHYSCGPDCNSHTQTIIDWEIHQAWRSWSRSHGSEGAAQRVRAKWLRELAGPGRDTVFFVGSLRAHPQSFVVLGVYWPPKRTSPSEDVDHLKLWG